MAMSMQKSTTAFSTSQPTLGGGPRFFSDQSPILERRSIVRFDTSGKARCASSSLKFLFLFFLRKSPTRSQYAVDPTTSILPRKLKWGVGFLRRAAERRVWQIKNRHEGHKRRPPL